MYTEEQILKRREARRLYKLRNKDKILAEKRLYYERHREELLIKKAEYRKTESYRVSKLNDKHRRRQLERNID